MKFKKRYLFLIIIPLFSFVSHKFYLSLTQIEYNSKEQSIQIIINVFMDDIELALNKKYQIDLQLTAKKELKNNDVYFKKYLEEKLQFKINDTQKKYIYLGKEYDRDLVYFYLEIPNINKVNSIEIINKILIYQFPNQQNLIKIKIKEKNKSILLTNTNDKGLLKF